MDETPEELVDQMAEQLEALLPVVGGVYSLEDAAADCGLADLWPGGLGQRETVRVLLHGALARGGKVLVDVVSVITRFGCRRLRREGRRTDSGALGLVEVLLRMIGNRRFGGELRSEALTMENWGQHEFGPGVLEGGELDLLPLRRRFERLGGMTERARRGAAFERLLVVLLDVFGLEPRGDLRREGEQVDATFALEGHIWLVEAKWTEEPAEPIALRDFAGKLAARPGRVLGVFVSVAGFTAGAIGCAKESRPGMLLLDDAHVRRVLDGTERLDDLLRRLHRRLVEKGESYEPEVERERLPRRIEGIA